MSRHAGTNETEYVLTTYVRAWCPNCPFRLMRNGLLNLLLSGRSTFRFRAYPLYGYPRYWSFRCFRCCGWWCCCVGWLLPWVARFVCSFHQLQWCRFSGRP